jgi:metal-responsive CopG/Arc/MetJ family transcriptional regulator
MSNVTVSVPDNLKKKMDSFATINWSEVARQAFSAELKKLELLEEITSHSKATDQDIDELARKIKKSIAQKHK